MLGVLVVGCTDNFDELNTDTKNAPNVPAETLFTNGTRNLFDQMSDCNVNRNVYRLYSQYWAQTTYPDESQYNMVGRKIPDATWNILYRDVLRDLKEAKDIYMATSFPTTEEEEANANRMAIIEMVEIYTYSILVDAFGDVPYTEALDVENVLPKYDDAKEIYMDLINRLTKVTSELDENGESFSATADVIYGGNNADWKAFGNSLMLKLAMRLQQGGENMNSVIETVAPNVINNQAQNFSVSYYNATPNTNPVWLALVNSGRTDFVPANTVVDYMNEINDPRRAEYFTLYQIDSVTLGYQGGTYGTANAFSGNSHLGAKLHQPELEGTLLSLAEVKFLLAQAAAMGIDVGDAETFYNEGIEASMEEWGVTMDASYLTQSGVAYDAGNWEELIGRQKWIALFNNGFEGWCTWRTFDFTLNVPDGMTYDDIPVRMIYPIDEATLNGANKNAAAAKYGNDSVSARLFWDVD